MLPGSKSPDGALYVTTTAPDSTSSFNAGVAVSPNGQVHVTSTLPPDCFVNGYGVTNDGLLCVDLGGVIAGYNGGIPFTTTGRIVAQLDQPVSPGDTYVGGLRVGTLGGVYVFSSTPFTVSGFSSGFDEGFA